MIKSAEKFLELPISKSVPTDAQNLEVFTQKILSSLNQIAIENEGLDEIPHMV